MRVVASIVALLCGAWLVSCAETSKGSYQKTRYSSSLHPISSAKRMVSIEGGNYISFIGKDSGQTIPVSSFYLDETPVTYAEFLEFLKANPQWTKSNVLPLYADSSYLKTWGGNFEIPKGVPLDAPVTNVSWFAAEAYAKSVGKRLPTVSEWEYVGLADAHRPDASEDVAFSKYILEAYQHLYLRNKSVKQGRPNYYGVYDMYGTVWEWTYDFNSVMMGGESRKDNAKDESLFCAGAAITSADLRNYAAFIRYALRGSLKANYTLNTLGFRCAKDKS